VSGFEKRREIRTYETQFNRINKVLLTITNIRLYISGPSQVAWRSKKLMPYSYNAREKNRCGENINVIVGTAQTKRHKRCGAKTRKKNKQYSATQEKEIGGTAQTKEINGAAPSNKRNKRFGVKQEQN
jgi:hypothetical protein